MAFDVMLDGGQYRLRSAVRVESRQPSSAQVAVRAATAARAPSHGRDRRSRRRIVWREQVRALWAGTGAVVRFGWLPATLAGDRDAHARRAADRRRPIVDAAAASASAPGLMRVDGDVRSAGGRRRAAARRASGSATSSCCARSRELKQQVDVWGPASSAADAVARAEARRSIRQDPQRGPRTDLTPNAQRPSQGDDSSDRRRPR